MTEARMTICYGCKQECTPKLRGEWYGSDCCDGVIVDQDGYDWKQEEIVLRAAELSEDRAESEHHC